MVVVMGLTDKAKKWLTDINLNMDEKKEVYAFLDGIRRSGIRNMLGAESYLSEKFGFDKRYAEAWLIDWLKYCRVNDVTTGKLVKVNIQPPAYFGAEYNWQCVDCGTLYPVLIGRIRCNGTTIYLCPWCRPDSRPWRYGRGG